MQLTIKGIKGDSESLEIPESCSVLELKALIMSQQGHAVQNQKLLFKGKILDDSKNLLEYGIHSGDTVIIMVTKQAEPSQFEKNVQVLVTMGIDQSEAESILRECDNDLEKAKKVILASMEQEEDDDSEEEEEVINSGTFNFLLESPQFLNIRDVLRQNPNELETLMTQLEQTNPELGELIKNNLDEFLHVVGLRRRPQHRLEISEDEQADIKELCELGFDPQDVLEAYLACDKNKDMAASYLFENHQQ
jgi:UV excision repair protein RAD23